jgi:hypothetical protein
MVPGGARGRRPSIPTSRDARPIKVALVSFELGDMEPTKAQLARCHEIMDMGEDWRGVAGRVRLADALLLAADGDSSAAFQRFEQAIGTLRTYSLPLDEAEALRLWSIALSRGGSRAPKR